LSAAPPAPLLDYPKFLRRLFEDFSSSRKCGASKITPHKRDALLQSFVLVLQIFNNHSWLRDETGLGTALIGEARKSTGIGILSGATFPFQ
jgi:hypothetical protein